MLLSNILLCRLFIILYKVFLTFESVDEILKCDHSSRGLLSSALWRCSVLLYGSLWKLHFFLVWKFDNAHFPRDCKKKAGILFLYLDFRSTWEWIRRVNTDDVTAERKNALPSLITCSNPSFNAYYHKTKTKQCHLPLRAGRRAYKCK